MRKKALITVKVEKKPLKENKVAMIHKPTMANKKLGEGKERDTGAVKKFKK